jgi:serine/threonine-protein kinase RsbW
MPRLPWPWVEVPAVSPGAGTRQTGAQRPGRACAAQVPGLRRHGSEGVKPPARLARPAWTQPRGTGDGVGAVLPVRAHLPMRVASPRQYRDWHRVASRTFPGRPREVSNARAFAAGCLDGFPLSDDAVLCVSELASNAVQHSRSGVPGGHFTVRIETYPDSYVWVEVEDDGGPWARRAHDDMPHHGLGIVGKIASEWGADGDVRGWIVWARLDWPA